MREATNWCSRWYGRSSLKTTLKSACTKYCAVKSACRALWVPSGCPERFLQPVPVAMQLLQNLACQCQWKCEAGKAYEAALSYQLERLCTQRSIRPYMGTAG